MIWFWLSVAAASFLAEAFTLDLFCLWYAIGAIVALIATALGAQLWLQIVLALVFAFATMIFLRPFAVRILKVKDRATNADALIGMQLRLLTEITFDHFGTVRINGVVWNATTQDQSAVAAGCLVTVESIRGNKLIVSTTQTEKEV